MEKANKNLLVHILTSTKGIPYEILKYYCNSKQIFIGKY